MVGKPGVARKFLADVVVPYKGHACLFWPYSRAGGRYPKVVFGKKTVAVCPYLCERRHGPKPTPKHVCRHTCGNGEKGCVTNRHLVWGTSKQNHSDRLRHGTWPEGENHGRAKLTNEDVVAIRRSKQGTVALAKRYDVDRSIIWKVRTNRSWRHL